MLGRIPNKHLKKTDLLQTKNSAIKVLRLRVHHSEKSYPGGD